MTTKELMILPENKESNFFANMNNNNFPSNNNNNNNNNTNNINNQTTKDSALESLITPLPDRFNKKTAAADSDKLDIITPLPQRKQIDSFLFSMKSITS
jgi:hypothetical protein